MLSSPANLHVIPAIRYLATCCHSRVILFGEKAGISLLMMFATRVASHAHTITSFKCSLCEVPLSAKKTIKALFGNSLLLWRM